MDSVSNRHQSYSSIRVPVCFDQDGLAAARGQRFMHQPHMVQKLFKPEKGESQEQDEALFFRVDVSQ